MNRREFHKRALATGAALGVGGAIVAPKAVETAQMPDGLDPVLGLKPTLFAFPDEPADILFTRVIAYMPVEYVDCRGDVQLLSGANLERFKQNPLILDVCGDLRNALPIGKVDWIQPIGDSLAFQMRIKTVYADAMRAGEIRFLNMGYVNHEVTAPTLDDKRRFGRGAKQMIRRWDLLEISPAGDFRC